MTLPNDLTLGTVISIHENPFPDHQGPLDPGHVEELKIIRRNTLNVFRQLSKANEVQSPIMTLPLRAGLKSTATMQDNSHENPASLLFYYIFDDWHTSYSLVARREHRYGQQLEDLVSSNNRHISTSPLTIGLAQKHVPQSGARQYRPPSPHRPPIVDLETHIPKLHRDHRKHLNCAETRPADRRSRRQRIAGGRSPEHRAAGYEDGAECGDDLGRELRRGACLERHRPLRETQGPHQFVRLERDPGVSRREGVVGVLGASPHFYFPCKF